MPELGQSPSNWLTGRRPYPPPALSSPPHLASRPQIVSSKFSGLHSSIFIPLNPDGHPRPGKTHSFDPRSLTTGLFPQFTLR